MEHEHVVRGVRSTVFRSDVSRLSVLERLLLTTDGTLTDMLETLCRESLVVRKLRQQGFQTPDPIDPLEVGSGEWLVERTVLLQGDQTGMNYVHARSLIALHRLDAPVRHELLASDVPIGRLWRQNRLETFKEVIECHQVPAGDIGPYFHSDPDTLLLSRTCRVQWRGLAVVLITEHLSPHLPRMVDRRRISRDVVPSPPNGGEG
jgi:chorismate-pyruvate lyase